MTASTTPTTALVPIEEGITFNLDAFPVGQFNRLIPTQTIRMASDLLVPVVQVVQLDLQNDCYESPDVPKGSKAIARTGLRKLATAAGISFIDERRTDDGSNPDACEVTCLAEMLLPTGQRIRATGMKRIDIGAQRWASDNQRAKFRSFFQEHVASRAQHRAIRALLSLRASYPITELARPFAVVSYAPNMNHPEIRARILDNMAPALAAGFGPEAKQLPAGTVTEVPQAPDDDAIAPADDQPAAAAGAEPDWFAGDPGPGQTTAPATPKLVEVLREKAAKSGLVGGITDPQKSAVAQAFGRELGFPLVEAGLLETFGIVKVEDANGRPLLKLTAAQAQAIIETSRDSDFRDLWTAAFASKVQVAA